MSLKTYQITGKAMYAKILGAAPPGYDNGPAEWSIDVVLDKDGLEQYKKSGADMFYVRTNKESGDQHVRFTRKAIKKDLTQGKPIFVVGPDGNDWDQTKLIGNGSVVNVRYSLNEITHKGSKRLKPSCLAIQIWEHLPYKPTSGFQTKAVPPEGETPAEW